LVKMNQSYFDAYCTPNEIAYLTKNEREGLALSRMGYNNSIFLNDKRREFYFDRTGKANLTDGRNANENPNQ
jgi:hypothetical protein